MEVRSYNAELAIANILFKRLFSNIQIEHIDRRTGDKKIFPVKCVLEQRSRILKNWENAEKRANYQLPLISINRTGFARNPDRVNGFNNEVKYEITSTNRNENLLTPVPVDISYDVTLMAKYPSDIDQIASNFMVFFNSDAYVTCVHPKYEGIKMNNQIIMSDSITEEHPNELEGTQDDIITATFQFTYKTYLFGGMQQAKLIPSKIISSYTQVCTSSIVSAIPKDELEDYIKNHPDAILSTYVDVEVTANLTTMVDNPDISSDTYDGFVPIIHNLYAGFYPVPQVSDFVEHMDAVDQYPISVHPYYFDAISWRIDTNSTAEFPYNVTYTEFY